MQFLVAGGGIGVYQIIVTDRLHKADPPGKPVERESFDGVKKDRIYGFYAAFHIQRPAEKIALLHTVVPFAPVLLRRNPLGLQNLAVIIDIPERTDDAVGIRAARRGCKQFQTVVVHPVIGIVKQEIFPGGVRHRQIFAERVAVVGIVIPEQCGADIGMCCEKFFGHLHGIVGAAVVDENYLEIAESLPSDGLQRPRKQVRVIVTDQCDGDKRDLLFLSVHGSDSFPSSSAAAVSARRTI